VDADLKTGDGAGVTTQIPYKLFIPEITRLGHKLFNESDLGVGFLFLPHDNAYAQARAKGDHGGGHRKAWPVPLWMARSARSISGSWAKKQRPRSRGWSRCSSVARTDSPTMNMSAGSFLSRNEIEKRAAEDQIKHFYIPSFSHRLIGYKGLLVSPSLEKFYKDLQNPDYETAICLYHQRYSTNTFPTWPLSQPFRMLAHNGEINTARGNVNWMGAREAELEATSGARISICSSRSSSPAAAIRRNSTTPSRRW
jgi:glutamate synthase (NADPH/NADH) large chain/glutamate synthase (ferredoxin)